MKQFIITFDDAEITIEYRGIKVRGKDLDDLCSNAGTYLAEDSRDFGVGAVDIHQLEVSEELYDLACKLAD